MSNEAEAFINGGNGVIVVADFLFKVSAVSYSLGLLIFNVFLGAFNDAVQVSNVVFKGLFLDIEDVSKEGFGVADIELGIGDFII